MYILLGEPREIRRETSGLHAVEKEVWTYATTDGAAGTEIAFFRCPDGGYRLDRNCPAVALSSASSDWYRSNSLRWGLYGAPTPTRGQIRDVISSIVAPAASSRPAEDHPAPTGTSSPAPAAEAAAPEAATKEVAYYFRAEDGSILTLLAVEVVEPGEGLVVGVTLEEHPERPREGVSAHRARTLLLEPAPPPAGPGTYFAKTYLNGGSSYGARFAVKDGRRDQILVRDRRLEVPDLSGFAASSIVPAERFGPASAGADGRFVVGSEEVLPRPSGEFRRGELLRLYLQVYGAAIDPATSMPRVDVSFRFHTDAKARPRSLRSPLKLTGATGASMGLALPIGDWPEGAYRVDVDLKDRVGGVSASVSGTFRIAAR